MIDCSVQKDNITKVQNLMKQDPDFKILFELGKDMSAKIVTYLDVKKAQQHQQVSHYCQQKKKGPLLACLKSFCGSQSKQ